MPKNETTLTLTVEQLEELIAKKVEEKTQKEAESAKANMSEQVKREMEWLEEKVPVQLFRDGKEYRDDVFACVGDTRIQIQRGQTVMVPRKIAMVLDEANRQSNAASDRQQTLIDGLSGLL